MRSQAERQAVVLLLAFLSGAAWCLLVGPLASGDPIFVFEIAFGSVAVIWGAILAWNLARGQRLSRELDSISRFRMIDGIPVNVVPGAGRMALVLGSIRPRIYVGDELLNVLADEELAAVLLHEDHHRSIRAPLRAAALEAWVSIVGRHGAARRVLLDRLVDLEAMADRHAVANGCSRSALASALVKASPGVAGLSAVSYGTERRVRALLSRDQDLVVGDRLPYEWLPIAVLLVTAAACHSWALSFLF